MSDSYVTVSKFPFGHHYCFDEDVEDTQDQYEVIITRNSDGSVKVAGEESKIRIFVEDLCENKDSVNEIMDTLWIAI